MNRLIILCIGGILLNLPVFSQETVLIKGIIIADSLNESAINIVNFTRKTGTTNNASGKFEMRVSENDTLIFSSVQHKIVEKIVTGEILKNRFMQVQLIEKVNELDEVHLSNINLTGNLEKDLKNLKVFNQAEIGFAFSTKPTPTLIQRKMAGATSSPLALLIYTLNGRLKSLKTTQEFMKFDAMVDEGVRSVPSEFFIENLKIPQDEIQNFVTFCAEETRFQKIILKKDHLALIELFYSKAPEFLGLKAQ